MVRTYPALWLLGAIVLSIAVADRTGAPGWLFPILTVACFAAALLWRRHWIGPALLLLAIGCGSASFYSLRYQPDGVRHISLLLDRRVQATVFGSVSDWPDLKERRTEIPIAVDSLVVDRSLYVVEGGLLLTVTDTTTLLQRGDRVIFRARLYPLPTTSRSGFNYSRYLSLKGLFGRAYLPTLLDIQIDRRSTIGILAVVDRIRDEIIGVFETCLTSQAAALAKGLMLGETRGIEPRVYAMFRDSGTLHLLAVSGSNVALVLLVFLVVVRPLRMPLKVRRFSMLAVIVVYALLCHLEPSVVRASVMAALVVFARLLHRKIDLNQIIALTAALILLYDPGQMFDVGFQLSFITAWGLIFIVPKITALLDVYHQRRWYRWLVFPLTISLTAQLVSTPLSVLYFQRLPLISVPANLIVVPLVTFCVIGLAAVLGAAAIHPLLGLMLGSWVDPLHRLTVWVLEQMGGDRMPIIETTPTLLPANLDWAVVLAVYGLMVLLILALRSQRLRRLAVFSIAGLFLAISALAAIRPVSRPTNVVFLHPAPGGAVAIRPLGESEGDVIVSSIIGRDYPLDSTVLWPLLKRHGIDSIHYLFIQGIAFDALDDVWRFAVERMADSVFVNPAQRAGLIDARRRFESGGTSPAMVVLSPPYGGVASTDAYWAGPDGLLLRFDGSGVLFSGTVPIIDRAETNRLRRLALVIGRRWQPAPEDWAAVARSGISPIIATSIRPDFPAANNLSGVGFAEELPDFLIDLNRQGSIVLNLSDNSWHGLH